MASKREVEAAARKAEKRARGKPVVSKFEAKRLTPEELEARYAKAREQHKGLRT